MPSNKPFPARDFPHSDPLRGTDEFVPELLALGDSGLLVRFSRELTDEANAEAISFSEHLQSHAVSGLVEIVPSLVSVFLRYDPALVRFGDLAGQVRLILSESRNFAERMHETVRISTKFGGEEGPDLAEAARLCGLSEAQFISAHNQSQLRVLATGFAPGFVYCGLHPPELNVPRRQRLHPQVPEGSILFAAGQTSITATAGPTGWHVIGRTDFRNFDPTQSPPTRLAAGDNIQFVVSS